MIVFSHKIEYHGIKNGPYLLFFRINKYNMFLDFNIIKG